MKTLRRALSTFMIVFLFVIGILSNVHAELVNTEGNAYFTQSKIPTGKTGQIMNVTFKFTADQDYTNAWVGIAYDDQINNTDESGSEPVKYAYPFEVSSETNVRKSIGRMQKGQSKTVSISARVRRDIPEGYYGVQVYVADSKEGGSHGPQEYVNVWIKKSTDKETETDEVKDVVFSIGEDQASPKGSYPETMNFSLNLKNKGKVTAQDVTASLIVDRDDKVFPFEIDEANYDKSFAKIAKDEVVSLDYSFTIRKDSYTGYYPIKMQITYRESSEGELKKAETQFYVHVVSKAAETSETTGKPEKDFNANDRVKARIVVDSYRTVPEEIFAGEEFELIVVMKNASQTVAASNILFSFESEKVSESTVFTTAEGSNSVVVNSLAPNATAEISVKLKSKPTIDQRSYGVTIKEKFDSPEFKNAEESVALDVAVKQMAKLTTGTITVNPSSIGVDGESNLSFQISNTGKVPLYNVFVKCEADSIKAVDQYVGNIKPGESGNVDLMLSAQAVTNDENSNINITITYEDENGVTSSVNREVDLTVLEEDPNSFANDMDMDFDKDMEVKTPWYKDKRFIMGVIVIAVISAAAAIAVKIIKKKKEAAEDKADDDIEI